VKLVEPYVPDFLRERYDQATRREIVSILQDSMDTLADFAARATIFEPNVVYEDEAKALLQTESARRVVASMIKRLREHDGPLTPESFKAMILATGQEPGLKGKDLYFPIRGAMTGSVHGPDLTRVAAVKGRDGVLPLLEGAIR
jgi:nondiscriminating glutamyl-tRNA synthetase